MLKVDIEDARLWHKFLMSHDVVLFPEFKGLKVSPICAPTQLRKTLQFSVTSLYCAFLPQIPFLERTRAH